MSIYFIRCGNCLRWLWFSYPQKAAPLNECYYCDDERMMPSIRLGGVGKEAALLNEPDPDELTGRNYEEDDDDD